MIRRNAMVMVIVIMTMRMRMRLIKSLMKIKNKIKNIIITRKAH